MLAEAKATAFFVWLLVIWPLAAVIAEVAPQLSIERMVLFAGLISFLGGFVTAWRETNEITVLVRSAIIMMLFGMVFAMVASLWTIDAPQYSWPAIGVSSFLSLGGVPLVDWSLAIFKRRVESENEKFHSGDE